MTTKTTKLPLLLDQVRIATPCSADWDDMRGDERVRFCGQCEKNVYDLSSLTRDEAEALLREKEGRLCVRFYERADGTVLTADCPVGVRRARLRQRLRMAMAKLAASAALALGVLAGRARADLTVDGKPLTTTTTKPTTTSTATTVKPPIGTIVPSPQPVMGGPTVGEPVMMGKIALPPSPPKPAAKPTAKVGEKAMMGDVAPANLLAPDRR